MEMNLDGGFKPLPKKTGTILNIEVPLTKEQKEFDEQVLA